MKILRNVNEAELVNFQREVYIMQQCSFDRNIVQFYGARRARCPWRLLWLLGRLTYVLPHGHPACK